MRTVSFRTLGCRLNQAETAQLAARFEQAGYRVVPFGSPCDVGVVHSCTVTNAAERESARLCRSLKRACPSAVVVLAGCAAQTGGEALRRRAGADLLARQAEKMALPDLLAARRSDLPPPPDGTDPLPRFEQTRALLKVQDGCSFGCAYCAVPAARGPARSRPLPAVLNEARRLAEAGYRELVLTGANLGCYAAADSGLVDLLAELESVPGIERLRLSSIELTTVERAVIDFMAASRKLCRYLHVPLQCGDDALLSRMGRRYRGRDFRRFADYACARIPRLGLGTDLIAGLPGETQAAFDSTLALVEQLPFSNLHVFPYSPRRGTPAAAMAGQVPSAEKRRRADALIELGRRKRRAFARSLVGRPVQVLIERDAGDGTLTGWTSEYVRARTRSPGARRNAVFSFTPGAVVEDAVLV